MFGLKGKTLLFFIITTILLSGLGVYFFVSLNTLMRKVEARFEPQQQTSLLKSLTLDVNNLNNQYLNDTIQLSNQYIDSIIGNVSENIKKIQKESKKLKFEKQDNLDTIPKMLTELKLKNFELKELRSEGENDFLFSLEKVIQDEFKSKFLSEKDSIIVTRQITSYIKENKIFTEKPKSTVSEDDKDERNFFQRLFKSNEKNEKLESEEQKDEIDYRDHIVELDTTTQQKVDTVNQLQVVDGTMDLISLFEEIQSKRIRYINNIQSVEKEIYELNYRINKNIEDIINDFILQQYSSYEQYLVELKDETRQKTSILLITILGFTLFSIVLLFRFFKDINKGEEYQNTLKIKEIQALKEVEEKQRFLNTMSHEIRTPLTSIIGYVDFLKGDDKNIKAIKSSANYLYQMTNEILDIAKINLGVIEIKEEPLNLTNTLLEIKNNFIPQLESKGLDFEFDIPGEPLYVKTDGQRIQQILYNLIQNAIKFTNEGFVKLKIHLQENDTNYHLVIRIIDTGIGMTKQEQKQVFKDFHQAGTDENKLKGTGLGLGIVEQLVRLLSGDIQLNSEKDKGTTFVMSFNFDKISEEEKTKLRTIANEEENFNGIFEDKNILIIDDDILITELYQKILLPTKAEISVFNNPEDALMQSEIKLFDLLIIDYKMPEMSGYDFLQELKCRIEFLPKTIISTANAMLDDTDKLKLKSFDKTIFKPLKKKLFLRTIAEVLEIVPNSVQKIENDIPISSKKITQYENIYETELTLESLKSYVGSEPSELIDVLEVIEEENEKSLKQLEKAVDELNKETIAFIIHQLSSRFAQTDETLFAETSSIEADLREDSNNFSIEKTKELLNFWREGQAKIRFKLKRLRQEL